MQNFWRTGLAYFLALLVCLLAIPWFVVRTVEFVLHQFTSTVMEFFCYAAEVCGAGDVYPDRRD